MYKVAVEEIQTHIAPFHNALELMQDDLVPRPGRAVGKLTHDYRKLGEDWMLLL